VPSPARLHVVRGDHMSFLREHRDATARKFAEVAGAGLEAPGTNHGATS
jgi:hypothetical protein